MYLSREYICTSHASSRQTQPPYGEEEDTHGEDEDTYTYKVTQVK
jgi:hypothetical protein